MFAGLISRWIMPCFINSVNPSNKSNRIVVTSCSLNFLCEFKCLWNVWIFTLLLKITVSTVFLNQINVVMTELHIYEFNYLSMSQLLHSLYFLQQRFLYCRIILQHMLIDHLHSNLLLAPLVRPFIYLNQYYNPSPSTRPYEPSPIKSLSLY